MNLEMVPVKGRSIYPKGKGGPIPKRLAWLHPEAAVDFEVIADTVVVSDMFRSPESSLQALKEGRGAAAPGMSSHNYGRAIDIDVAAAMKVLSCTKPELDKWMLIRGWLCWRRDGLLQRESWHYYHVPESQSVLDEVFYFSKGNAVAWWNRTMKALYPCKGPRAAAYVKAYEEIKEKMK